MPVRSVPGNNIHYIVTLRDVDGSAELRQAFGEAHRAYAASIQDRIVLAGPTYPDGAVTPDGSVFVVNFDTREQVEEFVAGDPYVTNGVYRDWTIVRFKNSWAYDGEVPERIV
jgi:hypothetical protein